MLGLLVSACSSPASDSLAPPPPADGGSGSSGGSIPPPPTLTSLQIEPANAVLARGESYPYQALGLYSDGHQEDLSQQVQWTSSSDGNASVDGAGTVAANGMPGSTTITATLGTLSASTPLTVTLLNHLPPAPLPLDFPTKLVDLVAVQSLISPGLPHREAASQMFNAVFRPYALATSEAEKARILQRVQFHCDENRDDPTTPGRSLDFPFQLDPEAPGALVWHRYLCTFALNYSNVLGDTVSYTSPSYTINQLDLDYGRHALEVGTAFEHYDLGNAKQPDYRWLGRYVQPLDKMLRRRDNTVSLDYLAGVNGGYDYRVDAWSSSTSDNICPPRTAPIDRNQFYSHPAPSQCEMGDDSLPGCTDADGQLPYSDDLGDSLVLLPRTIRQRSWRDGPFQSFNCGGINESFDRGVVAFYEQGIQTLRTSANRGDLAELLYQGQRPLSAVGCGPLLIRDQHFVYDEANAEEGMPIDNYEISGTVGIGYEHDARGHLIVHLAQIDGLGGEVGFHNWMLGPYFLSPYAHSEGANTLGNGGDATLWIHPRGAAVQAVLADPLHANRSYFQALFVDNNNPGVVSNCDFSNRPLGCRARPVHDGVFVRAAKP